MKSSKSLVHTYCSFISYIGTKFRGSQRQLPRRDMNEIDNLETVKMTVQQVLDDSLSYIVPSPLYTAGRKMKKFEDEQMDDQETSKNLIDNCSTNQTKDETEDKKYRFLFDDNDKFGYRTYITSRTDTGVCSTMNCYLFDLKHPTERFYKPDNLTMMINKYLIQNKMDVLVNKTIVFNQPSINFEMVKEKQYCYRLAFLIPELLTKDYMTDLTFLSKDLNDDYSTRLKSTKKTIELPDKQESLNAYAIYSYLPINEMNRCLVLNSKYLNYENNRLVEKIINIEKMKQAAQLFYGTWNFTTFSTKNNRINSVNKRSPIKTISKFEFKERNVTDDSLFDSKYKNFKFYDVYVKADGFLYNQIRRMMGCLISYGFGLIDRDDILFMLNNPDHRNFNQNCVITPGTGLYLNRIEFKEEAQEMLLTEENDLASEGDEQKSILEDQN